MRTLLKLALIASVLTKEIIELGILSISELLTTPANFQLLVNEKGYLGVGNRSTVFEFHPDGRLEKFGMSQYLVVNNEGYLVLSTYTNGGFRLGYETKDTKSRELIFGSRRQFQMCDGGLIGYGSKCLVSFRVQISYTEVV